MLLVTTVISIILFSSGKGESYGCNIFSNRFTVSNGVFKDVCGSISVGTNSGNLNSNDELFDLQNGKVLTISPVTIFNGNNFAIVIEGKRISSTNGISFDIILGPGGSSGNCQIRYETGNKIGIYSYYGSPTFWESGITLPDDVDHLHTLILYYNSGILKIYQNNKFVKQISKTLDVAFGRIGGWYSDRYPGDIGIKNIMFAFDQSLTDIINYVETPTTCCDPDLLEEMENNYSCREGCACCPDGTIVGSIGNGVTYYCDGVALNIINTPELFGDMCSTENAVITSEVTDSTSWNIVNKNDSFNTSIILVFIAGMGSMLILNVFCCGIYKCYQRKKGKSNKGEQISQQIEMVEDEMIEFQSNESKQITNTDKKDDV